MKYLALCLAVLAVTGCSTVPPTNVHQPMTARPIPRGESLGANGAIFQSAQARPLFEDRRARFVGDTITIKLTENTSASSKSNNKFDRSSSMSTSVTGMNRLPGKSALGMDLQTEGAAAFSGKGEAANNNIFTGSMTATVIEVLNNGNLLISGEKQLAIGHEQEYVRVSGVINPSFVDATNSVDSSRIADARIEYKSSGQIADSQVMGWMARFFLSVLPF